MAKADPTAKSFATSTRARAKEGGSDTAKPAPAKGEDGRFLSGNIGGGRSKGSRNKLSEAFIEALHADWDVHGADVIKRVREESPGAYLKVVASLVPRDFNVNVGGFDFENMSDEDLIRHCRYLDEALRPYFDALEMNEPDEDAPEAPAPEVVH